MVAAALGIWTVWTHRAAWRELLVAEAIFVGFALVALLLRIDRPQISGTEKPMDLGIFASLLRAESFPTALT